MTVRELAEMAGVSPATVSLVLNGKKGVSEKKRKEILKLVQEYEYKPQRKMDTESKNLLFIKYTKHGLIVEENMGFISEVMDGASEECQNRNYNLTIIGSEGSLAETLKTINYQDLYGILILGTELDETDYSTLEAIPIPYVVVDNNMPCLKCNSVAIDNEENVFLIIEYLAKLGFREVGYFKSNEVVQNFKERERGFFAAMKHFRLNVAKDGIFEVPPTMLGAFEKTQEYIASGAKMPPCLFIDNDTMTIGVMKALKIADFDIPGDISIVGFDDIPFAKIYSPTITTMYVNKHMLGVTGIDMLVRMIEDVGYRGVKTRISGHLIARQSTRELD